MIRKAVFSFLSIACASAFSAQMASQQWVMSRIEEEVDAKISTNNEAFVSAVLAVPIDGADSGDLAEIAGYGGYGTVGAAIIALIAGLAALKRRVAQKASSADLPYRLVEPGKWEFSASGFSNTQNLDLVWYDHGDDDYRWDVFYNGANTYYSVSTDENAMEVSGTLPVEVDPNQSSFTATRESLPGHLLDRACNRVSVTGATELTLPELVNAGKARDLLVRVVIAQSVADVTGILTFNDPTGEAGEITYETDGDVFPVPGKAGTWLYAFTETAAHTFAVSLKKVNTVEQGGA